MCQAQHEASLRWKSSASWRSVQLKGQMPHFHSISADISVVRTGLEAVGEDGKGDLPGLEG